MKINNISQTPSFKHKVSIDIGASNPKGSCKILVTSDVDGRTLCKYDKYLNVPQSDNFEITNDPDGNPDKGQADFIKKLNAKIRIASIFAIKQAEKDGNPLVGEDKKLTGVAVFVPGTTFTHCKDDRIAFIPNLRNTQGESLTDIDFKSYEQDIKDKGEIPSFDFSDDKDVDEGQKVKVSKNFELVVTKDLGGAGVGIAQKMAQKGMLQSGDYIMGIMTGGGFGSVDIKVKRTPNESKGGKYQEYVEFETSESSSYLTGNASIYDNIDSILEYVQNSNDPKKTIEELRNNGDEKIKGQIKSLEKLGRQGVSVKSHIKCFLNALDLDMDKEQAKKLESILLKIGDARIVSDDFMYVSSFEAELIKDIKNTGYFVEMQSDKSGKKKFTTNKDKISTDKIKQARIKAVNDYANAVSLISINKINDCLNKVVLVGPFAQGLNRHIKEYSEEYGAKDLPDLIMQKISNNIDNVDLPSTRRLMDLYKFQVICDPEINISDNTVAGNVLLDKKLFFTPNRGSWFTIPLETLQQNNVKSKQQ